MTQTRIPVGQSHVALLALFATDSLSGDADGGGDEAG